MGEERPKEMGKVSFIMCHDAKVKELQVLLVPRFITETNFTIK